MNMAGRKTSGSESVEEEEKGKCGEGQRNLGESQSVEAEIFLASRSYPLISACVGRNLFMFRELKTFVDLFGPCFQGECWLLGIAKPIALH